MASDWRQRGRSMLRSALGACRRAMPLHRVVVIFGLAGVAITQPVFDVLGSNPEFFVAGGYTRRQIVLVALVVVLVPPLLLATVVGAMAFVRRSLGSVAYRVVVASLAGLLAMVMLRQLGADNLALLVVLCCAAGVGVAWLEHSVSPLRAFLSYLCVGNVLFLGLFLFSSGTSELLAAGSWSPADRGRVELPELDGPVVVLILDEFPVTTLLDSDGNINDARYPGFARLGASSTFFRNASSRHERTPVAVPEMLTGRQTSAVLSTYQEHPRNLTTLFGPDLPVNRYELITDLCPPAICEPRTSGGLDRALRDSAVVYGHRALPTSLSDHLPSIEGTWGNFGQAEGEGVDEATASGDPWAWGEAEDKIFEHFYDLEAQGQTDPLSQYHVIEAMGQRVTQDPALHLIHVNLPHHPWLLGPDASQLVWEPPKVEDPDQPNYEWYQRQTYQLHAMQVGATDRAVDGLIDSMRDNGSWDDALVVVTSDHGHSLLPPDYGRIPTERNREAVFRTPLFIKAPGQTVGGLTDYSAQTIDVVPSIVDLLGIDTDWDFDGHSLFDGSWRQVEPVVSPDVQPVMGMVAQFEQMFPHGDDWVSLAAVGDHGDLVGSPVAELSQGPPSEWGWSLAQRHAFARLEDYGGRVPYVIGGQMRHDDPDSEPPELVVSLNGTIAGVAGGPVPAGSGLWDYTAFLADFFMDRDNEVAAYEVDRSGEGVALRRVEDL